MPKQIFGGSEAVEAEARDVDREALEVLPFG